jgi:CBS-domain-containing membrane protein
MPHRSTASEIMTRSLVTFSPETGIYTAVRRLISKKISGTPVSDEDRRLVGILSEKDCFRVLTTTAFEGNPEGKVCDYMTSDVQTVRPSTSFYEIVGILQRETFRRLPVIDRRGRLVGQSRL